MEFVSDQNVGVIKNVKKSNNPGRVRHAQEGGPVAEPLLLHLGHGPLHHQPGLGLLHPDQHFCWCVLHDCSPSSGRWREGAYKWDRELGDTLDYISSVIVHACTQTTF